MIDKKETFLSRWSRRKISPNDDREQEQKSDANVSSEMSESSVMHPPKNELPLWQQDGVEDDIKQQALAELFRKPEFHEVDHLNDYDDDFTHFPSLGGIVTQEMKRMIRVVEERTRPDSDNIQKENTKITSQQNNPNDHNDEENKLA